MRFKSVRTLFLAVAASVLVAGAASATSLSLQYLGAASGYRYLKIQESPVTPITGSTPTNVLAGAFEMRDNTANSAFGTFIAWCLDITHWLASNGNNHPYKTTNTPFVSSMNMTAAHKARIQGFFDANYFEGLAEDRERSAGFQMGLWEAFYDDDFSLTANTASSDDFRGMAGNSAANTAFGLAGGYLAAAAGYNGPKKWNLTYLESLSGKQNLVTVSAVPLPAAGLLLLTGLAGIGLAAGRRKA